MLVHDSYQARTWILALKMIAMQEQKLEAVKSQVLAKTSPTLDRAQ
jgi:hypothetical protein